MNSPKTTAARIVGTRLITSTANTDLAEMQLAQRQAVRQELDNVFRALREMAKADNSPEVLQSLMHASRALNALSEAC